MDNLENFNEITDAICADYKENNSAFYECFEDGTLICLEDFYEKKRKQEEKIYNEADDDEDADNNDFDAEMDKFEELVVKALEALDEYPSNLEKSKKSLTANEDVNSYTNESSPLSDISTVSTVSTVSSNDSSTSQISIDLSEIDETTLPSIVGVFADFRKFEKQLQQMNSTLTEIEDDKPEYVENLQHLKRFSMELKVIRPKENPAETALNAKQEGALLLINKEVEDVHFMVSYLLQTLKCNTSNNLHEISNILLQCIEALNILNTN